MFIGRRHTALKRPDENETLFFVAHISPMASHFDVISRHISGFTVVFFDAESVFDGTKVFQTQGSNHQKQLAGGFDVQTRVKK